MINTQELILSTTTTLLVEGSDATQSLRYARIPFSVPENTTELTILLMRDTSQAAQLPIALFDSTGAIRIMKASEGAMGHNEEEHTIGFDSATAGGIPGPIPAGNWLLVVYKRRFFEDILLTSKIFASTMPISAIGQRPPSLAGNSFSQAVVNSKKGWYCGELHVHSHESTGRTSVRKVLEVAQEKGLDFIALTDHFTASHWIQIQDVYQDFTVLCLQSMEVSGDFGHANIHGINRWINPLVDDNVELSKQLGLKTPPSMEQIADETHSQGGLFSINHAASGLVAWRYHDFPVEKADLFEIWCLADGPTAFLYPSIWDTYLCQGIHLTGVGSSDSHNPTSEGPWKLGVIRTWVQAEQLSQQAILSALKKGRCYVSYGPSRMEFQADYAGNTYDMGESIPLKKGDACTFTVKLENNPSGNLFVMLSGQVHDIFYIQASEASSSSFTLRESELRRISSGEAFVRLEFHEDIVKEKFWGMAYRDHHSMRLLSNPIWLDAAEEKRNI